MKEIRWKYCGCMYVSMNLDKKAIAVFVGKLTPEQRESERERERERGRERERKGEKGRERERKRESK